MTTNNEPLIAEMRERAEHPATGSNVAQCLREGAQALEEANARLAVLSAPQEGDARERVLAALNAMHPRQAAPDLSYWGSKISEQMRAALTAAGDAPQEPTLCVECGETEVLGKPEHRVLCMDCAYETGVHAGHRTPALDPEKVKAWLQREFGSVLAHDPHNPDRFWGGSADALCEAAKRGELT